MNHIEKNSFSMQEIEIETLREQLKKEQDNYKLVCKAFTFLQGEVVGKQVNANHPYYPYYMEYLKTINK
jgi:hypothetical protein